MNEKEEKDLRAKIIEELKRKHPKVFCYICGKGGVTIHHLRNMKTKGKGTINGEMPLCKTEGNKKLSRPVASIKMLEATHLMIGEEVWTKGKYKVIDVFDPNDPKINFEGCMRVKE